MRLTIPLPVLRPMLRRMPRDARRRTGERLSQERPARGCCAVAQGVYVDVKGLRSTRGPGVQQRASVRPVAEVPSNRHDVCTSTGVTGPRPARPGRQLRCSREAVHSVDMRMRLIRLCPACAVRQAVGRVVGCSRCRRMHPARVRQAGFEARTSRSVPTGGRWLECLERSGFEQ